MRHIFVDTSAWDAIADSGDPNHDVALLFRNEIAGQRRIIEVFAFDDDFAQMGFMCQP
jgi:predicted nucleic acid-binding protein